MDEYLTEESALHNLNNMLTEERNGYKDLDKVSIRELQAAPVGSLVKVKLPGAYGKLVDGVNAYKKTGEDEYTVLGDDGKEDEQFEKLTSSDLYWDLGNLDEMGQYTITAPEIKYVILDKHGRQRSAPNADDGELWDRVDSMDPRGDKGLHVVVFNEDLDEDYNKIAAERLNKKFKKEFPIGKELTTNDGEKFFVAKYLNKNKFTGMQTAYVLPIEYRYDARTGLKLEAGKQFDAIKYLTDYQDDEQLIEKIVKQGSKYQVQSEKGRNMGTYDTKGEAEDRLKEVEMFKHMNEQLTEAKYDADSNSYSIELEGSGNIDVKAIMKALGLEGNKSAGVMNTDGHINIYWNEKPEDTSFNYSKGNSKGTHHLSEYRDPREDLELLQRVPGVEWVYIDYPGEDVVEWEIEGESLNEDRKSDIEATLLDDEPSFADYMRDMYGMDIFDDPIADNPDVEDYYLDEYENYLDHLYDLDDDSNYDADHAAEWMERNPHGYYNDEADYGVDDEEGDTDPEQFLDAYELRRDMSDEEAKAQIKKVFDNDLKAGMIGQEDYDRGTKEVYDYWQKLHDTNEGLTEAVNSNLTDKEILDKCFIDTVTGSGPRIRIKVPYKMLTAYNVNLILDTFSNWIEEVLGNTVQNKSVTIDKSFIYNICRFTSNLTNNGVYIDLPINWRKYNALSADEKNYFCEAIYSFVNDEFKFSLPPENNSNNESLTEAKNKNYRVELYYYDNNKPDDVIYFENTKAVYNFCNNKISDNADYDDGLTGILVFNEAKDKLLNTWQNGSRGWENKSKALTEAVKPFVDDKVINSIRRYEMYHLPDSYIYADVDKAMRVDQVGTSSGEQPHDIIKATVCYVTQDNEEDYAEHKYKVFDDGRVEAISDESLNEAEEIDSKTGLTNTQKKIVNQLISANKKTDLVHDLYNKHKGEPDWEYAYEYYVRMSPTERVKPSNTLTQEQAKYVNLFITAAQRDNKDPTREFYNQHSGDNDWEKAYEYYVWMKPKEPFEFEGEYNDELDSYLTDESLNEAAGKKYRVTGTLRNIWYDDDGNEVDREEWEETHTYTIDPNTLQAPVTPEVLAKVKFEDKVTKYWDKRVRHDDGSEFSVDVTSVEELNESLDEAKFSSENSNDDIRLVKASYDHFMNDLGEIPSPDDILYDILDNYNQDIFQEGGPMIEGKEIEAIKYILRSQGLEYRGDLDEAKNDNLNADIWDENKELRPEVKEKLELIVEKFKSALAEDKVDLDIKDIIIVGSNANYNYGDNSDIDLHIVADLSSFKGREKELAATVYNCFRRIFNDKFDPKIRGHEVELYVEPADDVDNNEVPDTLEPEEGEVNED